MEPKTPQPGRIPPIQTAIKAPPVVSSTSNATKIAENPKEAIANKITAGVTQHFAAKDSQNRYQRALKKAQKKGGVPDKPQYRIKYMGSGGIMLALAIIVDIIGLIGTFLIELAGIPEVVVEIIDFGYGIALLCYMYFKHFEFGSHSTRYFSVFAGLGLELIPIANAAPFWTLDTWYVIHSTRKEDEQSHQQLLQEVENEKQEQQRQMFMENFARQQAEAVEGGNGDE